jgi:hypothetical protein
VNRLKLKYLVSAIALVTVIFLLLFQSGCTQTNKSFGPDLLSMYGYLLQYIKSYERADHKFDFVIAPEKGKVIDNIVVKETSITIKGVKPELVNELQSNKKKLGMKIGIIDSPPLSTFTVAADPFEMESASVTLDKFNNVEFIARCDDFDFDNFFCRSRWARTDIPFTDNGDSITFTVDHFSAYAGSVGADNYTKLIYHMEGDASLSYNNVTGYGNVKLVPYVGANSSSLFKGSAYFDGSGDYLSIPDSADWDFGTNDLTIDFWVKLDSLSTDQLILVQGTSNNDVWWFQYNQAGGNIGIGSNTGGVTTIHMQTSNLGLSPGVWYHVAYVRDGTTASDHNFFLNGVSQTLNLISGSYAASFSDQPGNLYIGMRPWYGMSLYGSLDELRISNTARWTANFTPPIAPYSNRYTNPDSNTKLLLHFDGDESFQPVHVAGYGAFDGSGDYLNTADSSDWDFGSGDFTIGTWVNFNALADYDPLVAQYNSQTSNIGWTLFYINTTHKLGFGYSTTGGNYFELNEAWTPGLNTWYYVTAVRSGSNFMFYLNGAQLGTTKTLSSTIYNSAANLMIDGEVASGGGVLSSTNGKIDEVKIFKGRALSSTEISDTYNAGLAGKKDSVGGTSLVGYWPMDGDFNDYSGNGHTMTLNGDVYATTHPITLNGNPKLIPVQNANGPFLAGAMYFNGSSYLTLPDSPEWYFGSDGMTIDTWIKYDTTNKNHVICRQWQDSTHLMVLQLDVRTSGGVGLQFNYVYGSTIIGFQQGSLSGWNPDTWYHVAIVRNGNTFTLYRNGVSLASDSYAGSLTDIAAPLSIGDATGSSSNMFQGYIDDFRISKGIARYTSNFTPEQYSYDNTLLTIWDETDNSSWPYAGKFRLVNENVKFFANYSNTTGVLTGATCNIWFNDTGSTNAMTYNSTSLLYEYSKSYSAPGYYRFNVTCNLTGFDTLTASDLDYISLPISIYFVDPTPPNNTVTINTSAVINTTVIEQNSPLAEFKKNWNGTNYTFYNDSLVLMLNFDNVAAIGENSTKAVDVSRYGSVGTIRNAVWTSSGRYDDAMSFDGNGDMCRILKLFPFDTLNSFFIY